MSPARRSKKFSIALTIFINPQALATPPSNSPHSQKETYSPLRSHHDNRMPRIQNLRKPQKTQLASLPTLGNPHAPPSQCLSIALGEEPRSPAGQGARTSEIQSDPLILDPAIPDIRYTGRGEKAPASQSHLAITDKLKFWWFRYNGNLVSHVRYKGVRLYTDRGSKKLGVQWVPC